jgi:putrescine aminotransferase
MSTRTTDPLPATNQEGMDLMAQHLSAERTKGFAAIGLSFVQGHRRGVRIRDLDGNEYINCRSSGGVFNFGHRPAFAIDALKRGLDEFGDMGDWLLPSAVRARGAAALASILPGDLQYSFFTPGGGEAIEVACKLARGVTGRTEFVAAELGYHGHIGFSLAMDEPRDNHWFTPLVPGIVKVPFGDADAVDRAVTDRTAAVCMETVPATAGYLVPPDDFWPRVRAICDERGALLILDEVQAGLGRTGKMWACNHWDVVPDMLITGKCLSGGVYPIAACCFGDRVDAFFAEDPFFHPSSYGGSELGATVVEAVVDQLSAPGFLEHVGVVATQLERGLDELCAKFPTVLSGRRGIGLMQVVDTPSIEVCAALMAWTILHGVLAIRANNQPESLLIMPPLVITESDVDDILAAIGAAAAVVFDAQ